MRWHVQIDHDDFLVVNGSEKFCPFIPAEGGRCGDWCALFWLDIISVEPEEVWALEMRCVTPMLIIGEVFRVGG